MMLLLYSRFWLAVSSNMIAHDKWPAKLTLLFQISFVKINTFKNYPLEPIYDTFISVNSMMATSETNETHLFNSAGDISDLFSGSGKAEWMLPSIIPMYVLPIMGSAK